MNRFECSSMTREELEFTVRIEHFSMRSCKRNFESSKFESPSGDTKWSLVVYSSDGSDYLNYIDVRLKLDMEDYSGKGGQFVKAKVAIQDRFGFTAVSDERDLFFGETGEAEVFSVTKGYISGRFGLTRYLLLPNDTLTLVCKLVLLKESAKPFETREDFERRDESTRYTISPLVKNYFFIFNLFMVAAYGLFLGDISTCMAVVRNDVVPFAKDYVIIPAMKFVLLAMIFVCMAVVRNDVVHFAKDYVIIPAMKFVLKCIFDFIQYASLWIIRKIKRSVVHIFQMVCGKSGALSGKYNKHQRDYYYTGDDRMLCAEQTTRRVYVPKKSVDYLFQTDHGKSVALSGKYNKHQRDYNYTGDDRMLCAEQTTRRVYVLPPRNPHYRKFGKNRDY